MVARLLSNEHRRVGQVDTLTYPKSHNGASGRLGFPFIAQASVPNSDVVSCAQDALGGVTEGQAEGVVSPERLAFALSALEEGSAVFSIPGLTPWAVRFCPFSASLVRRNYPTSDPIY